MVSASLRAILAGQNRHVPSKAICFKYKKCNRKHVQKNIFFFLTFFFFNSRVTVCESVWFCCNVMIWVLLFSLFSLRAVKFYVLHVERIYFYLQCALKMSENSSDSDSSCGWTVINHEVLNFKLISSVSLRLAICSKIFQLYRFYISREYRREVYK